MPGMKRGHNSFFIDYVDADLHWVEWVVWQLEDAGYTVVYRGRDFRAGMNIVEKTNEAVEKAERVLIVLSPDYLKAHDAKITFSGSPVWTTIFLENTRREREKLLPL
ncbi:MAG: toll/interleukin-1 receptor domain-containing protein, partial [Ktedonobacteraceae bacterium]|nr:toll/interleukin-1 receptor domain-containing protein [Ktedonobacteraceae bacterium]MBV9711475.1 toll/interleukin-1 receptor domain-containing protein [Ktedonobacteraceae bacterium]